MADTVRKPLLVKPSLVLLRRKAPKPAYRESAYVRPILQRLTPLTWFVIVLGVLGVLAIAFIVVNSVSRTQNVSVPLPTRLAELHQVDPNAPAAPTAAVVATSPPPVKHTETNKVAVLPATPTVRPTPTQAPTPTPTPNPNDAPWARQLVQQPDGTWTAPEEVVNKAIADLSAYYTHQQNLTLDQFMRERFDLLNTYFTGQALVQMRQKENDRTHYAMNRSGTVIIEIRNFSVDGNSAVAGVTLKAWVDDVYDVKTRKLIKKGVSEPDSLLVMSISFDRANGRWKFATLDPDSEVQQ
jgi:hypothetical protein